MRFLLDTNILIPLENSNIPLVESLANFVRIAHENGHQLVYHPASEDDIARDTDVVRRQQTLERLKQYTRLADRPPCPWNMPEIRPNDAVDNEILYSLHCEAVHALVTEDRGIHDNARNRNLVDRVYTIQTAEDWLRRLHEKISVQLPNIEDVTLSSLTSYLSNEFFDGLRDGYQGFDKWFRDKARDGREAWVAWDKPGTLGAICVYAVQPDELITKEGTRLAGKSLKLCTFKVGPSVRGRKIGELLLKMAFRYATVNHLEHIFIHGDPDQDQHHFLFELLEDFGFSRIGTHPDSKAKDVVYLKRHPVLPPIEDMEPFKYFRLYFPHFKSDSRINKYVIPIRPEYHRILFPDYSSPADRQLRLLGSPNTAGNAIKLAYLCHAPIQLMSPGDVVMFYRSGDERAITSLGIVENFQLLADADEIARLVRRRTVYSMEEIINMANKPTRVILFRLVRHFNNPVSHAWLKNNNVVNGNIQSICSISNDAFKRIWKYAGG